jgi:hypothetical protein
MSGLNNMKKRLSYRGGANQQGRMIADKRRSLDKALMYSYQSATALKDGAEFRCLINPNKVTMEIDDKELSIPFEAKVKVGDVIGWKENNTHWMVYSQFLEEIAYFRGLMRQCDSEQLDLGNGIKRWVYIKGPEEKNIDWQKTDRFFYNTLNYTLEMYISNDSDISEFFQRFKKVNFRGKTWEVQAIDDISTDGIIVVYLKEDFTNEFTGADDGAESEPDSSIIETLPRVVGPAKVYPYDILEYKIEGRIGGKWLLSNRRAQILEQTDTIVKIEITTGKSGDVSLVYKCDGFEDIIFNIKIQSL